MTMTHPRTPTITRRLLAIGAATVVLATGACSAGSDKKAEAESAAGPTTRPAAGATVSTTTTSDGSGGSKQAPSGSKDEEVLASTKGQQPADPNDSTQVPLRMDVTGVERLSGDTVEVRFTLTNTDDVAVYRPYSTLTDVTIASGGTYDVGGIALLDRPNDKKYLTLYDTENVCLCSDLRDVSIDPGKTVPMYADVTAPPESVDTVDLSFPGFAPLNGLAIR